MEVINPNNFFLPLTCANIFVPENTVKTIVNNLFKISRIVKYLLNLLVKDC